jgi:hypothetical protein
MVQLCDSLHHALHLYCTYCKLDIKLRMWKSHKNWDKRWVSSLQGASNGTQWTIPEIINIATTPFHKRKYHNFLHQNTFSFKERKSFKQILRYKNSI